MPRSPLCVDVCGLLCSDSRRGTYNSRITANFVIKNLFALCKGLSNKIKLEVDKTFHLFTCCNRGVFLPGFYPYAINDSYSRGRYTLCKHARSNHFYMVFITKVSLFVYSQRNTIGRGKKIPRPQLFWDASRQLAPGHFQFLECSSSKSIQPGSHVSLVLF